MVPHRLVRVLGRAVEYSARAAGALFTDLPLQGQVNLLTTGAFDNPFQLLQLERTRSVAYFAFGAPRGRSRRLDGQAALNQGDLELVDSGRQLRPREPARHRYQFGMSYGVHRYEGGNVAAMAAVPDRRAMSARCSRTTTGDVTDAVTLGYGAALRALRLSRTSPSLFSPRLSATITPDRAAHSRARPRASARARARRSSCRRRDARVLPPQRTFAPLTRDGFFTEDCEHYEVGVEQVLSGATLGVRAFQQRVDDQLVTVFGLRRPDAEAVGDSGTTSSPAPATSTSWLGLDASRTRLLANVRGSVDYSFAAADVDDDPPRRDCVAGALRAVGAARRRANASTTSRRRVETDVPPTATRVFFIFKMNSAYIRDDGTRSRARRPLRHAGQPGAAVHELPCSRDWEMLVAVRNCSTNR